LKFGLANNSIALAIDAGKILHSELMASTSEQVQKIRAVAEAQLLEVYTRSGKIAETRELISAVSKNASAEWLYALAICNISQGKSQDIFDWLSTASDLGHFRSRLMLFALGLMDNDGYSAQEEAIAQFDKDRREWGEPSHTGLPAEARLFFSDVERVISKPLVEDGEILIASDVLVCSLTQVFMDLPALATEIIIRSANHVPDEQIEHYSLGIGALLDRIHDITLAKSDLSRFPEVVDLMERVGYEEVILALAQNKDINPTFTGDNAKLADAARGDADQETLLYLAAQDVPSVQLMVSRIENLSAAVYAKLAESDNQEVLDSICTRPEAPLEVIETIISKASSQTLWKMASDAQANPQILTVLSTNKADSVRRAVAGNPGTNPEVLEVLALDPAWAVREQVVANPNASDNAKALAALQS
jgi:hypothetical protein